MFPVLLIFGLVSTALCSPGPVGVSEGLPEWQVEQFFDNTANAVYSSFSKATDIPDSDWGIDSFYGIPFKFKIQTKNGKLSNPTAVRRVSRVTANQELSGTAHIQGYLYLGTLEVSYETLSVNIFGLEMTGKAVARLNEVTTPVNIHIYKNTLQNRQVTASIGELTGYVTVHLGSDSGYEAFLGYVLDFLFFLRYTHDVFRWAFFQTTVPIIENAIASAANSIPI